ncbi:MAG TPA: hypothetical protein VKA14_01965 [Gammaproteobacteria bacterium]|nr:hypothetical protein [Gammaproteobacteria bacterium]
MDNQIVELLGRNRLVNGFLAAGIDLARPQRDRGVDLIAYADLATESPRFRARPIQMKASSGEQFSVDSKYQKISDLILAFVWHAGESEGPIFALPYPEALRIGDAMGWTETRSWLEGGKYTTSRPPGRLKEMLAPYRTTPARWRELLFREGDPGIE